MKTATPVEIRELMVRFGGTAAVVDVRDALRADGSFTAAGLWGAAGAFLLATLERSLPAPILVATADEDAAEDLATDLGIFLADPQCAVVFPAFDRLEANGAIPEYSTIAGRLLVLTELIEGRAPPFIVSPAAALLQAVPDPERLSTGRRSVAVGDRLDLEAFARDLVAARFDRVPMVEAPGEFSIRGGILDVFPLSREAPWRVELFDDEVESIRQFEPASQRSVRRAPSFLLSLLPPKELEQPKGAASLVDYLPEGYVFALDEPDRIREWITTIDARSGGGGLVSRLDRLLNADRSGGVLRLVSGPLPPAENGVHLPIRAVTGGARDMEGLEAILADVSSRNRTVLLFADNAAESKRLSGLLGDAAKPEDGDVEVRVGRLSSSFQIPDLGLALLSHDEILDRYRLRRPPRRSAESTVVEFADLRPGDHVVHLGHGIGIYRGVHRLVKGGVTEEFLKVEFADEVVVYVPVSKANLVQRYVGTRAFHPRLSKVGGSTWVRQKERVRDAVMDMAADLLDLQAARAAKPGIAYPGDDRDQHEFEASFLYEDTPDQVRAAESIKGDMQQARPMDRLLCGDVGYGKTELAMRAVFKAVMAGRQVAVLVPTTVLAQQHFETFSERFVDYPIVTEVLSRFRTAKEQKDIVERTSSGAVDVLIGTHRLVSPDVSFRDLGLVIVDEEQRFGVEHKTRLRQLRKTVDVLTMTATPIPRTLHMALLGIKDISTLATPPPGRQSIRTEIVHFDEARIRKEVLFELDRGGQVFYVHNRVHSIDRAAKKIENLVPEARIAVVHGQMNEHELEKRMLAFVRREVDVLVTTTIIESGLDIPNANTIFVDRADRFGLAELHQLRGRVGRYRHRAYCYLIVPPRRVSNVAEKRIRAIEEFQDLGAGFRIAMRDLEIRGAGNILGREQSGHIATVGYELYCQLLGDAVRELEAERHGTKAEVRTDPFVEIDVGARLPPAYVPDELSRVEFYKKLSRAPSEEALDAVVGEIRDRFGPMPEAAVLLVELARVRVLASRLRIEHIVRPAKDRVVIRPSDLISLLAGLRPIRKRVRVVTDKAVHLLLRDPVEEGRVLLADLQNALKGPGGSA